MSRLKYFNTKTNQWEYADNITGNNIDLTNYATKEYVENTKVGIDTTLQIEGKAADAKAVGEAIKQIAPDGYVDNPNSGGNVNKNGLTLGIHSDGLVYVFVDGVPVGNGIEMATNGDVFGYVDENNNIIVSGNLPDGTYSVKYEMEDGSTVDIGELSLIPNIPDVIVNLLETAYDTDLETVYNGIGWKSNTRVKSDGTLTTGSKCILTGFIPFVSTEDVFHIRGVEGISYLSGSDRGSIAFYGDGLTFLKRDSWLAGDNDEFGDFTIPLNSIASKIPAETKYMRFHLGSATGDVIMTRNQLITV